MPRQHAAIASVALVLIVASSITATGASTSNATGTSVTVMTIGDLAQNPEWPGAVEARFEAINARGGIRDASGARHEVNVLVCDTKFDASATEACVARAVDRRVAAVVGMSVANGQAAWPRLEAAGIPVIGARINTQSDVTSPASFPVGSGVVGVFAAMPQLLVRQGAHKIGVVVSDFGDATASALALIQSGLARSGATAGPTVRIPLGVTEVEPYVADLTAADVDGVVAFVAAPLQVSVLEQLLDTKYRGHVVVPSSFSDRLGLAMGEDTDGTLVVGEFFTPWTKDSAPGLRRFRADLVKHDTDLVPNEGAVNFWLAAWVFQHVATGLPRIDAPAVREALSTTTGLDTGGLTPPFPASGGSPEFPRLLNPTVSFARIEDGIVTPFSKHFFDPLTGSTR